MPAPNAAFLFWGYSHALHESSEAILLCLGRGCFWGGLAAGLVWAVCRVFPRMDARVRFWLWWTVCAKLVFSVFFVGIMPVFLPPHLVMPSLPFRTAPPAVLVSPNEAAPSKKQAPAKAEMFPAETAAPEGDAPEGDAPEETEAVASNKKAALLFSGARWADGLMLAYLAGLFLFLGRVVRAAQTGRRVVRFCRVVEDDETRAAAADIAGAFWRDGNKTVRVLESGETTSPFVAGLLRPVLVLPEGLAQSVTKAQLRLILAHEMAHIRRGDLWLSLMAQATRTLLWFFPLAHLACREVLECAEEACDAAALRINPEAERGEMGHLLLRFSLEGALGKNAASPVVLGMAAAPGFARLKRRLRSLQSAAPMGRAAKAGAFLMAGLAGVAVLPWCEGSAGAAEAAQLAVGAQVQSAAEAAMTAGAAITSASAGGEPAPRYELVDLGADNETYSDAYAVSEAGVVVGTTGSETTNGRGVGFAYDAGAGRRVEIGSAPYRRSVAVGISPGGAIAALGFNRRNRPQAFVWQGETQKTPRTFLWPLSGYRYSQASGINGRVMVGAVHGLSENGVVPSRAFSFAGETMNDLGTLGGPSSWAYGVNPNGLVVGKADIERGNNAGETHAFALQTGPNGAAAEPMRDLGTLAGGRNSRAQAVSGSGAVVGFSEVKTGAAKRIGVHAFLAAAGEPMRDLGTLGQRNRSAAYGINDNGLIVGAASSGANKNEAAVLWVQSEKGRRFAVDLNGRIAPHSGWVLTTARGVNNRGWIVGQGRVHGKRRAFLLKPI